MSLPVCHRRMRAHPASDTSFTDPTSTGRTGNLSSNRTTMLRASSPTPRRIEGFSGSGGWMGTLSLRGRGVRYQSPDFIKRAEFLHHGNGFIYFLFPDCQFHKHELVLINISRNLIFDQRFQNMKHFQLKTFSG